MKESSDKKKGFCAKLTRTELILFLILIGTTIYIIHLRLIPPYIAKVSECSHPSCYESIIEINNFIDPSIDPCEDFHQFACGHFLENAFKKQVTSQIAPEEKELDNEWSSMILDSISSQDSRLVILQKRFFQACNDEKEINENSDDKVLQLINEIGGWPLHDWNEKEFDWIDVMVKCKKLGLPFQWFLKFDVYEEDVNYLRVTYPVIQQQSNQKTIETVLGTLLKRKVYVNEIVEFENRLKKLLSKQNSHVILYTVKELQTEYPLFNWLHMLNDITEDKFEFTEETQVAFDVQTYIVQLFQLVKGTPKRTQATYIAWKIIEHFLPFMSETIRTDKVAGRSQFCEQLTKQNFPFLSEIEYAKKYATGETKSSAAEIAVAVREEFLSRIKESTWWNTTAGEVYLSTFETTEIDIGLDLGTADDEFLDANYLNLGNLTFESSHMIDMVIERSRCYHNSLFSNINQTGVLPEVKKLAQQIKTMNIFFDDTLNKMVVPPSVLHGFAFDRERSSFLNFASFGTLLAKEFIRSLQIFTESDKNVTNAAFGASDRCFEDDYLNTSETTNFGSSDVVQEVLPHIIALDIAYAAYQNWVTTNGEEIELPLLTYTPNQLFWIKSSIINCYKKLTDEDETEFKLMVSKYKNVLSARHSRHFADVFSCSETAMMNPTTKC